MPVAILIGAHYRETILYEMSNYCKVWQKERLIVCANFSQLLCGRLKMAF